VTGAQELPFDPIAHGWPDRWDGLEYRPLMEWYVEYVWPVPCECTYCKGLGDHEKKDCVVIRTRHGRMKLGYLETRCADHPRRQQAA
jgi:hypothetical protein